MSKKEKSPSKKNKKDDQIIKLHIEDCPANDGVSSCVETVCINQSDAGTSSDVKTLTADETFSNANVPSGVEDIITTSMHDNVTPSTSTQSSEEYRLSNFRHQERIDDTEREFKGTMPIDPIYKKRQIKKSKIKPNFSDDSATLSSAAAEIRRNMFQEPYAFPSESHMMSYKLGLLDYQMKEMNNFFKTRPVRMNLARPHMEIPRATVPRVVVPRPIYPIPSIINDQIRQWMEMSQALAPRPLLNFAGQVRIIAARPPMPMPQRMVPYPSTHLGPRFMNPAAGMYRRPIPRPVYPQPSTSRGTDHVFKVPYPKRKIKEQQPLDLSIKKKPPPPSTVTADQGRISHKRKSEFTTRILRRPINKEEDISKKNEPSEMTKTTENSSESTITGTTEDTNPGPSTSYTPKTFDEDDDNADNNENTKK